MVTQYDLCAVNLGNELLRLTVQPRRIFGTAGKIDNSSKWDMNWIKLIDIQRGFVIQFGLCVVELDNVLLRLTDIPRRIFDTGGQMNHSSQWNLIMLRFLQKRPLTSGIQYWGIYLLIKLIAPAKFVTGGQDISPKTPTLHTRSRWATFKKIAFEHATNK